MSGISQLKDGTSGSRVSSLYCQMYLPLGQSQAALN